jgi:hypothetical protein
LYILWDAEPGEWLLVFPERRLDEYTDILNEIPAENKIPLSDITDVYLELMPSTSFRVYLSPSGSGTGVAREESTRSNTLGQETTGPGEEQKDKEKDSPHTFVTAQSRPESRNGSSNSGGGKGDKSPSKSPARPLVLKITPQPSVRGHAAMWVDAIYAAMQLQCHEPAEEVRLTLPQTAFVELGLTSVLVSYEQVHGIRTKFYETMHLQQPYTSAADDAELEESLSPGRHLCVLFTRVVPRQMKLTSLHCGYCATGSIVENKNTPKRVSGVDPGKKTRVVSANVSYRDIYPGGKSRAGSTATEQARGPEQTKAEGHCQCCAMC